MAISVLSQAEQVRRATRGQVRYDHASGPQNVFAVTRGVSRVDIAVRWSVTNEGDEVASAGMRFHLKTDSQLLDDTQLVINADRSAEGFLIENANVGVELNYPVNVFPDATAELELLLFIPSEAMLDAQASVSGFSWWVGEATIVNLDTGNVVAGDGRDQAQDEIRDWFALEEAESAFRAAGAPDPRYGVSIFP